MARLMSAVRNSNTRASHASVDMNNSDNKGSGPAAGSGANAGEHFTDGPDRRTSFSYLRRASERRRRLRMKDRQDGDDEQNGRDGQDDFRRDSCATNLDNEDDGQLDSASRRDSTATGEPRLRRSEQIYDEDVGEHLMNPEVASGIDDQMSGMQHDAGYSARGQARHQQQQASADSQRRQSMNDRLAECVTDVMEFVREESFKRGKRHSFHRRRQAGLASGIPTHSSSSVYPGVMHNMEGDQDSEGVRFRKRRVMRRSPRQSSAAHHQRQGYMNDSDTGSMASVTQEQQHGMATGGRMPLTNFEMQQHHHHQQQQQQRIRLQQHSGSVQDSQGLYGSDSVRAQMMQQHRRHQSADACDLINDSMRRFARHQQHMHGSGYISELDSHMVGQGLKEGENDEHAQPSATGSSIIRPIPVGQSPPHLMGRSDVELLTAARRKRENEDMGALADNDEETAIHLGSDSDGDKQDEGQVRFIAPSVAPLSSPSALIMPDEEIVPPDVPYRGRRLPQIPGSRIIRSAADFLQSSFYGRHPQQHQHCTTTAGSITGAVAAATSNIATTPLVGSSRFNADYVPSTSIVSGGELMRQPGESIFPSVSESPTSKREAPLPLPTQANIIKRQPTLDQQIGGAGSSLDGSGSINFPRVSFSPTHGMMGPSGVASTSSPSYHSAMIATQSGGTQSTVLAPIGATQTETMLPDRLAWTRGRLVKKEEKDDWF